MLMQKWIGSFTVVLIVLSYVLFPLFLILNKGFVQTQKDSHNKLKSEVLASCFPWDFFLNFIKASIHHQ